MSTPRFRLHLGGPHPLLEDTDQTRRLEVLNTVDGDEDRHAWDKFVGEPGDFRLIKNNEETAKYR